MGKNEIEQFLTYLETTKNISPTTQNQAFNALLFLYYFIERTKFNSPARFFFS